MSYFLTRLQEQVSFQQQQQHEAEADHLTILQDALSPSRSRDYRTFTVLGLKELDEVVLHVGIAAGAGAARDEVIMGRHADWDESLHVAILLSDDHAVAGFPRGRAQARAPWGSLSGAVSAHSPGPRKAGGVARRADAPREPRVWRARGAA